MDKLIKHIKSALASNLPGASSHKKMLPPNRVLKVAPTDKSRVKYSSVLLLLFLKDNELTACLTKRSSHMKHHAGQISFPGGRMEKGETYIDTALRETFEEIGISSDKIEILGKLSEFYVEVSHFQIQPIVAWLNEPPQVILNYDEVEKLILFPLKNFKPPYQHTELNTLTGKLNVPCIKFEGEIIWGATAMILSEFYDVLKKRIN